MFGEQILSFRDRSSQICAEIWIEYWNQREKLSYILSPNILVRHYLFLIFKDNKFKTSILKLLILPVS